MAGNTTGHTGHKQIRTAMEMETASLHVAVANAGAYLLSLYQPHVHAVCLFHQTCVVTHLYNSALQKSHKRQVCNVRIQRATGREGMHARTHRTLSITTMTSASRMVLSRCAIAMVVPLNDSRSATSAFCSQQMQPHSTQSRNNHLLQTKPRT